MQVLTSHSLLLHCLGRPKIRSVLGSVRVYSIIACACTVWFSPWCLALLTCLGTRCHLWPQNTKQQGLFEYQSLRLLPFLHAISENMFQLQYMFQDLLLYNLRHLIVAEILVAVCCLTGDRCCCRQCNYLRWRLEM